MDELSTTCQRNVPSILPIAAPLFFASFAYFAVRSFFPSQRAIREESHREIREIRETEGRKLTRSNEKGRFRVLCG